MEDFHVDQMIERKLQEQKNDLLSEIGQMIKLSNSSNSTEFSKISKLISPETPKFKRKSNEEQYKANKKVLIKLDEAYNSEDPTHAKINLKEAMDLLEHRQKLVCLADSSELGWRMVSEYESNPLADDSDDEKRMYKAEARAARKLKAERGKRTARGRYQPYTRGTGRQAATLPRSSATSTSAQVKPGLCFSCGKPGHWKNECQGPSNNKLSKNYDKFDNCQLRTIDSGAVIEGTEKIDEKVISPVGSLKRHINMWKSAVGDGYIVSIVEKGYKLPFRELPASVHLKNNKSARENPGFVSGEISRLLEKGVVREVTEAPFVVNPLTVAYGKTGKPRLVLDCRHINPCLHLFKVKFEDIRVARSIFLPNSFIFTYDLKSAYHHIDIYESHQTYLGFSWEQNGKQRYYVYCSLPFGVKTAGHIFTKMCRVVVKYLREKGHKVIMFLDDGIGGHTSFEEALKSSTTVQDTLDGFGFLLAHEKCSWYPQKVADWLGFVLDFNKNRFFIKEDRIARLELALQKAIEACNLDQFNLLHVKTIAAIVGQIISLQFVIGSMVRMYTRALYNCILSRASWNSPVIVSNQALKEMMFWKENARKYNNLGKGITTFDLCNFHIFCDASGEGYGGFIESNRTCEKVPSGFSLPTNGSVHTVGCRTSPEVDVDTSPVLQRGNPLQKAFIEFPTTEKVRFFENRAFEPPEEGRDWPPEVGKDWPPEAGRNKLPEASSSGFKEVDSNTCHILGCYDVVKAVPSEMGIHISKFVDKITLSEFGLGKPPEEGSTSPPDVGKLTVSSVDNRRSLLAHDDTLRAVGKSGNISEKCSQFIKPNLDISCVTGQVVGTWSEQEKGKSSTWREAEVVRRVIKSNLDLLKNNTIKVFSDNKNVSSVLLNGSKKHDIQDVVSDLFDFCKKENISVRTEWIPRKQNVRADLLSRCGDSDDWYVSDSWFRYFDQKWGPHTVDRFASPLNKHCTRFNSRWWYPGTEAIDAFSVPWENERNWVVPPPRLIYDSIRKTLREKAICTFIVPLWRSDPFWASIVSENGAFKNFIKDFQILPKEGVICRGPDLKRRVAERLQREGIDTHDIDNKRLADDMSGYLLQSRAVSTSMKYSSCFEKFEIFCREKLVSAKPASSMVVALYLTRLMNLSKSLSVINSAVYAIKWMHSMHGYNDPTDDPFVRNLLESAKRLFTKPVMKKDVIDSHMLICLCEKFIPFDNLIHVRDLTMILLCYAGFLRFNDTSNLHCSDVTFYDEYLSLHLRSSKTDVYREGKDILVSKGLTLACPYAMLKRYMSLASLDTKSEEFLFKPLLKSKGVYAFTRKDKKLSYTRARECIVSKLKLVAPDLKLGTHSLRASGATSAANTAGISDRCIKRHGRWKSDQAKDGYICDSIEKKLAITKCLGL